MLNNIQKHTHTVYSHLQALLTDHHKLSAIYSQSLVSIHTRVFFVTQIITYAVLMSIMVSKNVQFKADTCMGIAVVFQLQTLNMISVQQCNNLYFP